MTRISNLLKTIYEQLSKRKGTILALSAVVVFVTTYMLILPAMTLEKDEAISQGGIDVPAEEQTVDAEADEETSGEQHDSRDQQPEAEQETEQHSDDEAKNGDSAASNEGSASHTEDTNEDDGDVTEPDAEVQTEHTLTGKDSKYKVFVKYGADAEIPEGASLSVTELNEDSDEFKRARELVNEQMEPAPGFAALDISIIDPDGIIVEPRSAVDVVIEMKDLPKGLSSDDMSTSLAVHHIVENKNQETAEVVAVVNDKNSTITVDDNTATAEFSTESFSTYTISWGGGLVGRSIQDITSGDYIVYARDAHDGNYYALVPSTDTYSNLTSVQLTNNNGVISYSGNNNLYWRVNVSGDGDDRTFTMSRTSGYWTYYACPANANLGDGQTSNLRVTTNAYSWRNWSNHIFCAGDTFMRSYKGTFQVWNQNNGNWQNMTNIYFAKVSDPTQVTVHYGYMDGNTFKEFAELPEGAQTSYGAPTMIGDQLNVRYDIEGKDYVTTRINNPSTGTQISPLLQTEANSAAYWRYRILSTTAVNGGINEWQTFGDNDHDLYVIYRDRPTQKSYDTGDIDPGDLEAPSASKTFESNQDGTYDLVLGVTGKSNQAKQKTHANVVIVLDTSSSMKYTYSENPQKELGHTRLSAAQDAICGLADQLFGMNSREDPAAIEVAFVNFSHRVRNEQTMNTIYSGTNPKAFKDMIKATNGNGGTNYDTAIEAANSILWNDADPTYVVFVTDGDTVSRGYLKYNANGDGSDHASDWDGGTYYTGDTAHYGDTYLQRAREAAKIQVDKIINSGKKFYSIGVFGNVVHLSDMGGTYLGQANDKQAIQDAFSKIISEIELDLGYKDVVVNDGLTALTSTTLEHGSAGNFTYYRSGGTNKDGTEKYRSTANDGRGELWDLQGSDKEAFFLEIKDADTFYKNGSKWTGISTEQKAAYIEKYGIGSRTVIWDLGSEMLEDGVTYKVAFTIWPSQEAYDLVANLNNGTVKFADLEDSVKAQIVENNGVYYVKTNTVATVDYTSVRMENGSVTETKTGSSIIKDPQGKMNLDSNIMSVRKEFAHLINEVDPFEKIVFYLLVDGKYYNKDGTLSETLDESKVYAINLPKNDKWEDQIYIAPGLMRGGEILETGHNYSLEEKIISGNPYEYEFAPQTVRPMVIKTVPTFLIKKDSFNTNTENKKEYTFKDTDSTYVEVSGKSDAEGTYYAAFENNGSLTGVNHKTAELDITKIINDPQNLMTEAQETSETFTYRVTLQIPDGCDPSGIVGYEYVPRTQSNAFTLFGYQTGQSAFPEDIARFNGKTYRAWNTLVYDALIEYDRVTENGKTVIKARRDTDGNIIWKVPAVGGYHTITYDMTLKQDEVIRFTNLPTGTKYTVQEIYANKYPADNAGGKTDGRTPVSDAGNLSNEGYEIEKVQHSGGTLSEDKATVTGIIEAPDTRYYNQFTNKKVKADNNTRAELKVRKVVEDYTWGKEYYRFTLKAGTVTYSDAEGGSGTSPMPDGTQNSVVSIYETTADHTLSFGTVRYTRPGTYTYTVSEYDNSKNMPNVQFASPVNLTVTVTADRSGKLSVAKIEDNMGTTVYSAETGTALAAGLTTQTNTSQRIRIKKVDKNNPNKVLTGAAFEIRSGGIKMYLQDGKLLDAEAVEKIIGMPPSAGGADKAMEKEGIQTSFTLGEINIGGFSYDTVYELKEFQAPTGYVITDGSVYFKAVSENEKTYLRLTDQNGNVLTGENGSPVLDNDSAVISENALSISVKNEPGAELPHTGGIGTTWLYILGAMLVIGCAATFAIRKMQRTTE